MMDAINSTSSTAARWSCAARATCWGRGEGCRAPGSFLLALHHMDDFISIIRDSKNGMKPVNACRTTPSPRRRRKALAS
ncbi:MAG: hypothetical protein ACLSUW_03750 [Akkermansia sp.]